MENHPEHDPRLASWEEGGSFPLEPVVRAPGPEARMPRAPGQNPVLLVQKPAGREPEDDSPPWDTRDDVRNLEPGYRNAGPRDGPDDEVPAREGGPDDQDRGMAHVMNMLQDLGMVSDNCVTWRDVPGATPQKLQDMLMEEP